MNQLLVIDGVSVRQDTTGRYCLNDLHRTAGEEGSHNPANNITNPNSPRETQPHFYITKAQELIRIMVSANRVAGC